VIFDLLHVRIRIKLLGLVLLPVVGGAVLSGFVVADQTRLLERMQRLRGASSLSISVGNLVHALQAESDDTALHLGSRGAQHQEAMLKAREVTNRERGALDVALREAEADFSALIPPPVWEGSRLKELRQRADKQGGTLELIDGYGREVDALVQVQNGLMLPAAGTPLEGRFQAFATLLRAKESTGLEGAILASAFSMGAFDAGARERLQSLLEAQKAQGEAFLATAPEASREDYRQALAGAFSPDLQRMRALAQAGKLDQDPELWARLALSELEALKGVQDRMSRGLLEEARDLERGARTKGWLLIAGFGVFGLAVLLWTWRATILITEPIQALEVGMTRMRQGDLRIQLPVHSYDETGRMTEVFNAMSAHLRELVQAMQGHAARVSNGAAGLSASAGQVSTATQQLAASSRVQRTAFDDVAFAVTQLQTSVLQVRASLDAMVDGGRSASQEMREASQRARGLARLFQYAVKHSDPALHAALAEGESQVGAILLAMAHVEEMLRAIEGMAGEIHKAAEEQSKTSNEVSRRMQVSQSAVGEVQLAAAQLANTAPEVVITSRDLVQVAQSLKAAAAAFQVE
jgi:methyl-accepting chemotaxis protein